jgi:hypothetical protein
MSASTSHVYRRAVGLGISAAAMLGLVLATPDRGSAARCPGRALSGVQRPRQLVVLDRASPCRTATGIVRSERGQHDGDCHVNVKTETPRLLNSVNATKGRGLLITEVIPRHRVPLPPVGSRVRIYGTWVLDKATGWKELHPVWSIQVLVPGTGGTGTC